MLSMPRYKVTLTEEETQQLKAIIRKGGKGYRSGMHRSF